MKGKILIRIGVILIVCAFLLTGYNLITGLIAKNNADKITDAMVTEDNGIFDPDMEMPSVLINGVRYIGTLEIPSVGVKLPVAKEWSYDNLSLSPCRYTGSVYKRDMVIAAHNYRTHFGKLFGIAMDDKVRFTDVEGRTFDFVVEDIEVRDPYDIEGMVESDYDLTLFTCTLGGRTRLTIRCAETNRKVD